MKALTICFPARHLVLVCSKWLIPTPMLIGRISSVQLPQVGGIPITANYHQDDWGQHEFLLACQVLPYNILIFLEHLEAVLHKTHEFYEGPLL